MGQGLGNTPGQFIRGKRLAKGLSQEGLSVISGVSVSSISDIETGITSRPTARTLYRIAEALSLSEEQQEELRSLLQQFEEPSSGPGALEAGTLASALRSRRSQLGLSVHELARRSRLGERAIRDAEAGRRRRGLQPENAASLAGVLRLDGPERDRFILLATSGATGTRLPGRDHEITVVTGMLDSRSLTVLTGAAGIGKTTVAEAVLAGLDRSAVRLYLADVPAGENLKDAITLAAGLDERVSGGWSSQLDKLLPVGAVLLLDNLEHLRQVPSAIEQILTAGRDVAILATSRTSSGVPDEACVEIGLLSRPAACEVFLGAAEGSARQAPRRVIEGICERLDRLPLAITLAATWTRLMTPQDILARLGEQPGMLTDPRRPAGDRHATVAHAIERSLALVGKASRSLFEAMAAYPAPWPLDLVEAMGIPEVHRALDELAAARLVTVHAGATGVTTYSMLQTVRDVGIILLRTNPESASQVMARHAAHTVARARLVGQLLHTADRPAALVIGTPLAPHVLGALRHLVSERDERAVTLVAAWWRYWQDRGQYRTGRALCDEALLAIPTASAADTAQAIFGSASLSHYSGDNKRAALGAADALTRFEALQDMESVGYAIDLLAMIELTAGHDEAALRWYQRGLASVDPETAPRAYARLLANTASVHARAGDLKIAQTMVEEAAARFEILGNHLGAAASLANLAGYTARSGGKRQARELFLRSRTIQDSLTDSYNVVQTTLSLAMLALEEGDLPTAKAELATARRYLREQDNIYGETVADAFDAQVAVLSGDTAAGRHLAVAALVKARSPHNEPAIISAALAAAAAAAWTSDLPATLKWSRAVLEVAQHADESEVVAAALLIAAARCFPTTLAGADEDVLELERLVAAWAAQPAGKPPVLAVGAARHLRFDLTPPGRLDDLPSIDVLRQQALALTTTMPEPG